MDMNILFTHFKCYSYLHKIEIFWYMIYFIHCLVFNIIFNIYNILLCLQMIYR